ncbi:MULTISPECIES: ribosome assembly RNA-binding protein YhbY [Weissella]|jgi:RNA-binding protein|uniref:RNA-binding protein n=1 Tax=Weissella hellenica TaxID=46256 RepID=A0A4Y4G7B2_WEIHE|nr:MULTISPECIES: ribosome assembly RNA-binding protein YhbY [Weissella]KAA8433261.1 ribosome assembly RNA-binding protein YhbY [Weissella paramesenteroides]KAA8439309.1 ribosome assembly RNA-binding protein YhbY [Weissella paramesenteroides]MBU7567185.1 ribosome assembly RNA-binding protein YhbY [Weissella hellenica]NKY66841.1 ribosome assembly RNA-binding protein YhbY [Weissella hellenica]SCB89387.1 RNA-binding protein [Weissella hellenica]
MISLRGKQKRYLRASAHDMRPLFSVGKQGLTKNWLDQLEDAINKRELFKVNILANSEVDTTELKTFIEENSDIQVVQTIGHTLVLFGESDEKENRHYSVTVQKI